MENVDFDCQFVKISIINIKIDIFVWFLIKKKIEVSSREFENQINPVFKFILI